MKLHYILALVPVAAFSVKAYSAPFELVRDGAAVAGIELANSAGEEGATRAVRDVALFNRYLKQVTGGELVLAQSGGTSALNRVVVELRPVGDLATRYNWDRTFPDARTMRIVATPSSLFIALRHVLEDACDARFLGVEDSMFQFEPRRSAALGREARRSAKRSFTLCRNVTGEMGHEYEMGFNQDHLLEFSHGIPGLLPCDRYRKDGWPKEIMPRRKDGSRLDKPANLWVGWQPCYMSGKLAETAVETLLGKLAKKPDLRSVSLSVNDVGGYCQCERCLAENRAYGVEGAFRNASAGVCGSYYRFANRVAAAVSEKYPGIRFGALAYTGTSMPPTYGLDPHILPVMTMTTLSSAMDPAMTNAMMRMISAWGAKVPETGIWEYDWGRPSLVPRVDFAGSARWLKYLYAHNGRSYFAENAADMADGPKLYLKAKLLEDVDRDPEEILDEWYVRFAGRDAAAELRALYAECTAFWSSEGMRGSPFWHMRDAVCIIPSDQVYPAIAPGFTKGLLDHARRVLALARTSGEKRRAEILCRHFELLDSVAVMRGWAYQNPGNGEFDAGGAVKALGEFAARAGDVFAAWKRVDEYFHKPDLKNAARYRRVVEFNEVAHVAELVAKTSVFLDRPEVAAAFARARAAEGLPDGIRGVFDRVLAAGSVAGESCVGETNRWHGTDRTLTKNLEPGIYLVSAKLSGALHAEMCVYPQCGGRSTTESVYSVNHLGGGRRFAKTATVRVGEDGLNVVFRSSVTAPLMATDVRVVKLADPDPRTMKGGFRDGRCAARCSSETGEIGGEKCQVFPSGRGYYFAEAGLSIPLVRSNDVLHVKFRLGSPESADPAKVGAILNRGRDVQRHLFWNHQTSSGKLEDLEVRMKGSELGFTSGNCLIRFYLCAQHGTAALSSMDWWIEKK